MKHTTNILISLLFFLPLLFFSSCERDITLDLTEVAEEKIVIEGHIEQGIPPYIILTKTISYFESADAFTFENLFIHDAVITVTDDIKTLSLVEYCSNDVPEDLLPVVSEFLGVPINSLSSVNFCVYTVDTADIDTSEVFGAVGKTYELSIEVRGKLFLASTMIPQPVPPDSLWFVERPAGDGLGLLWMRFTDPPGIGNNYRMFTRRLGMDDYFLPSLHSSVLEDRLINGKTFDFYSERGTIPNMGDEGKGLFKSGDTVVVKWCSIDKAHYDFWKTAEIEIENAGNPIAAPTFIITNIVGGGLGVWGGYGVSYDTLIVE